MNKDFNYHLLAQPVDTIQGSIEVPGDKSISHRSIILGAIAEGTTKIKNYLTGEDSLATLKAFQQMGVPIKHHPKGTVTIQGVGLYGLKEPQETIWLGNSGTAMRLMAGLLAGQKFPSKLCGDQSLCSRPMKRVTEPLVMMGAQIKTNKGCAPIDITPVESLRGIDYALPVASAQIKSALLLAGLYATSPVTITEPGISRNHSELMMQSFLANLEVEERSISIKPGEKLQGQHLVIPGDISSAAFFLVAATIAKNADILIRKVSINPTRIGLLHILNMMGAQLQLTNKRQLGSEMIADIRVTSSKLKGIDIPENLVPLSIDEFPVLLIAASCAKGTTRLTGASELRVKESDRIEAMVEGLQRLGIKVQALSDGAIVKGGDLCGGEVESYHDHRIAMAFTIASVAAKKQIRINNCININTSFPGYEMLANSVGLSLKKLCD